MTSISQIISQLQSDSEDASEALVSIAERAAGYTPVLRKSQISKCCCCFAEDAEPAVRRESRRTSSYIIC